jgi:hypothetical protein
MGYFLNIFIKNIQDIDDEISFYDFYTKIKTI